MIFSTPTLFFLSWTLQLLFSSSNPSCNSALTFLLLTPKLFIAFSSPPSPTPLLSHYATLLSAPSSACFLGRAAALLANSSGLSLGKSAVRGPTLRHLPRVGAQKERKMERGLRLRWISQITCSRLLLLKWHRRGEWQWKEVLQHSSHMHACTGSVSVLLDCGLLKDMPMQGLNFGAPLKPDHPARSQASVWMSLLR